MGEHVKQARFNLKLVEIDQVDVMESYACYQRFEENENGFVNEVYGMTMDEYRIYLEKYQQKKKGIGLADWEVVQTVYMLMEKERAVGIFKLRHYLTKKLQEGAGHIGYGICKSDRGKGYASEGLNLLIDVAKKVIAEDEIYFSVSKNNTASYRVQLKNGAYQHHEDDDHIYTRIKIK